MKRKSNDNTVNLQRAADGRRRSLRCGELHDSFGDGQNVRDDGCFHSRRLHASISIPLVANNGYWIRECSPGGQYLTQLNHVNRLLDYIEERDATLLRALIDPTIQAQRNADQINVETFLEDYSNGKPVIETLK